MQQTFQSEKKFLEELVQKGTVLQELKAGVKRGVVLQGQHSLLKPALIEATPRRLGAKRVKTQNENQGLKDWARILVFIHS